MRLVFNRKSLHTNDFIRDLILPLFQKLLQTPDPTAAAAAATLEGVGRR